MKKVIAMLMLFVLIGCESQNNEDTDTSKPIEPNNDAPKGFEGITKQQCLNANGNWNECGSPCAGTNADFCIEMCQVQCECGGIAGFGCPEGYKCRLSGEAADEMGVCIK